MAVQLLERRQRSVLGRESSPLGMVRHLDVLLVASALVLTAVGLVMVYSATEPDPLYYLKRQIVYAAIGGFAMIVMAVIDYRRIEEWAYALYGASFLALLAVRAVGRSAYGAAREISLGPLVIQPSEFAVLALVIAVAAFMHRHEGELGPKNLARLVLLVTPTIALVYLEPDLGTTLIMVVVFVTMVVVGGVRLRYLGLLALAVVSVLLIGTKVHLLHGYQIERLSSFLHQDDCASLDLAQSPSCWQLVQAKTAIGAGGLHGTGILQGAVTRTGFVPDAYADMIFSAVGEQLGFIGAAAIIGLFTLMALRMVRAIQVARDSFGRLICAGALAFVVFSVFQNVGMNVGIMPITGIPLPFISFGGSALFATFAAVGLVVNVELRRSRPR